jgi:hypothetical protein
MKAGLRFTLYGYAGGEDGKIHACHDHRIGTGDSRGSRSVECIYLREPCWPATNKGMREAGAWSFRMNRAEGERIRAAQND